MKKWHSFFLCGGTGVALTAAMLLGGPAPAAQGAYVLVENFNGLSDGDINGQNGWTSSDPTVDVSSSSPFSSSDKGLNNGTTSTYAYKDLGGTISDGSTGTLFFQLNASNLSAGTSFGLADSPIDGSSAFQNFRSQIALSGSGTFVVVDATGSVTLDQTLSTGTWYNIWIVSDNASNTSQFYIQGGSYTTQTLLTANSGATTSFSYRDDQPGSAALSNFLIASGTSTDNATHVDNIWFDDSGANLANPVPEPSALALLALGGLLIAGLRCCRRTAAEPGQRR